MDDGAPISRDTVAAKLGHSEDDLVQRVYCRVGKVWHRSNVVGYRWQQRFEQKGGTLVRWGESAQTPAQRCGWTA
jgi:hypothetical protein